MATEWGVQASPWILYDGTNAEEIAGATAAWREADYPIGWTSVVVSELNGHAVFTVTAPGFGVDEYALSTGFRYSPAGNAPISAAQWDQQYIKLI